MEDIFVGLFLVGVLLGFVSVATEERIHPEVMEEAVRLCENNDGLDYIEADSITENRGFYGDVVCNNGFEKSFPYKSEGEKE